VWGGGGGGGGGRVGGASTCPVSMCDIYTAYDLQLARKYISVVRPINFCQCML